MKAIESHPRRWEARSCWRGSGKRNTAIDQLDAEGYLFFSEPPPPPSVGSRGGRGTVGRGGRGARGGGRSGPGRGRKSEATKAADQAKLAAFLAVKYPETSRFAAAAYGAGASSSVDSDEVEFMGDKTWAERNAELRREAVSLDDGDSED